MTQPLTLPTFLVIGAMKAGTTALHEWLSRHPDAYLPAEKELNFFATPLDYSLDIDAYAARFRAGAGALARGEASPSYTMWPSWDGVPERIARHLPDVRLVYCVRDPIARMQSQYLHGVSRGLESRPAAVALVEDPRYARLSRYSLQISRYLKHFSADQLEVVCAEDLAALEPEVMTSLCRHLGLDPDRRPQDPPQRVHSSADKVRTRPWAAALEGRPSVRRGLQALPVPAQRAWSRVSRTELDLAGAELPPRVRETLEDLLRSDVVALQPWLPPDHDGWGLL